jgi:hypothetical protein
MDFSAESSASCETTCAAQPPPAADPKPDAMAARAGHTSPHTGQSPATNIRIVRCRSGRGKVVSLPLCARSPSVKDTALLVVAAAVCTAGCALGGGGSGGPCKCPTKQRSRRSMQTRGSVQRTAGSEPGGRGARRGPAIASQIRAAVQPQGKIPAKCCSCRKNSKTAGRLAKTAGRLSQKRRKTCPVPDPLLKC